MTSRSTDTSSESKSSQKPLRFRRIMHYRPRRVTVIVWLTVMLMLLTVVAVSIFYKNRQSAASLMKSQLVEGAMLARAATFSSDGVISWDAYADGGVYGTITSQDDRNRLLAQQPFIRCTVGKECSGWISAAQAQTYTQPIPAGDTVWYKNDSLRHYGESILRDTSAKCAFWQSPVQRLCVSAKTGGFFYYVNGFGSNSLHRL